VLVADLHERALAKGAQHGGVEQRVVFPRPTADVLEGAPIVAALRRVAGSHTAASGMSLAFSSHHLARGFLAAFVEVSADSARTVMRHEDVERAVAATIHSTARMAAVSRAARCASVNWTRPM